jgi:hypothetical protein
MSANHTALPHDVDLPLTETSLNDGQNILLFDQSLLNYYCELLNDSSMTVSRRPRRGKGR